MGRIAPILLLAIFLVFSGTGYALGDQLSDQTPNPLVTELTAPENPPDTPDTLNTSDTPETQDTPDTSGQTTAGDVNVNPNEASRSTGSEVSRGSSLVRSILTTSQRFIGAPYRYGGTSIKGFDCSGFVGHVFGLWDIKLPRSSRDQASVGTHVDKSALIPGDLVFFKTGGSSNINHVGIYFGDNRFIHSSTSKGVIFNSLDEAYYLKTYYGARRILP